jgi:hypothetical protein
MTNQVKDAVSCVNKLVEISEKINEFKDNKEDVEELIKIMGYSSKIESVLDWLMNYEESPISIFKTEKPLLHTTGVIRDFTPFERPALAREMARAKQSQILEMTEGDSATNGVDDFMLKLAKETVDKAFEDLPDKLKPRLIDQVKVGDDLDNAPEVSYTITVKEPENPIAFDPNPPSLIQIGKLENSSSESAITLNGEPVTVEEENVNPYAAGKDEVVPEDGTQEMYDEEEKSSAPPEIDLNGPNLESYKHLPSDMLNKVIANYDKHAWLKHDKDAEWKRNEEYPFMCSENGKFFNLMTNKIEQPYWLAGEMFINVNIPGEEMQISKRCGIMLATVFSIKRPYSGKTDNWVIDFKNGDRRDLRVDNLTYIQKKSKPSDLVLLLNDICQRCIDNNFDVKKVVKIYEGIKDTNVNQKFVSDLINKHQRTDITNKYWHLENNKPVVNTPKLPAGNFLDIAGIFERSKDAVSCIPLFLQKIDGNYDLNAREKELLCNLVKRDLPSGSTYSEMSKNMLNTFHWDMTPDEIKAIMLNKTSITTLFNQVG